MICAAVGNSFRRIDQALPRRRKRMLIHSTAAEKAIAKYK